MSKAVGQGMKGRCNWRVGEMKSRGQSIVIGVHSILGAGVDGIMSSADTLSGMYFIGRR